MQNSLILASGSPRRRELLSLMGITYQICPADVDEHMTGAPDEVVMALSRRKALAVAERQHSAWRGYAGCLSGRNHGKAPGSAGRYAHAHAAFGRRKQRLYRRNRD